MRGMLLESKIERRTNQLAVVQLTGALSLGSSLSLVDSQVIQLVDEGVSKLVIDVTGVTHADSSGLGFLMHANGMVESKGGSMRLAGVGHRLLDLLTMTRVNRLLKMDATAEESLKVLEA
jgi:anti-sigma B factor antagonist